MLIAVERLLLRLRQVPSRAEDLLALRRRVRTERGVRPDADERATAIEIRAVKLEIAAALAGATSCGTCATGKPWPRGAHAGGDCCSGETTNVFDEDEVAALAQAGTRTRDLIAPRGEHPGCAFRGASGCTLAAEHRPGVCTHYVCGVLRGELHGRGDLDAIAAKLTVLRGLMTRFAELRQVRLDRELLAPIERALGIS